MHCWAWFTTPEIACTCVFYNRGQLATWVPLLSLSASKVEVLVTPQHEVGSPFPYCSNLWKGLQRAGTTGPQGHGDPASSPSGWAVSSPYPCLLSLKIFGISWGCGVTGLTF